MVNRKWIASIARVVFVDSHVTRAGIRCKDEGGSPHASHVDP